MTIESEITRIKNNIKNAYTACGEKGAELPAEQNSNNLATCVETILTPSGNIDITENGNFNIAQYATANVNVENKLCIPLEIIRDRYTFECMLAKKNTPFDIDTGDVRFIHEADFQGEFFNNQGVRNVLLKNIESLNTGLMNSCFEKSSIETISAPKLTKISNYLNVDASLCTESNIVSVSFPMLTEVEGRGLSVCFASCDRLQNVDFSSLKTLDTNSMLRCFDKCPRLSSVLFPELKNIYGNSLDSAFAQSGLTSISFPKLDTIIPEDYSMSSTFAYCKNLKDIYFNSLTANTFQNFTTNNINTAFNFMLGGVKNCTVHFKSELQEIFKDSPQFKSGFGGTNTVILFDL